MGLCRRSWPHSAMRRADAHSHRITCRQAIVYLDHGGGVFAAGVTTTPRRTSSVLLDVSERSVVLGPSERRQGSSACMQDHGSHCHASRHRRHPGMTAADQNRVSRPRTGQDRTQRHIVPASCRRITRSSSCSAVRFRRRRVHVTRAPGFCSMSANLSLGTLPPTSSITRGLFSGSLLS